jgi:hypothetical protein
VATVQILDDKKYRKAIGLLYDMGGIFRTKPTRQLVVGPYQLQVLRAAGVLAETGGAKKRGKKKKP